MNEKVEKTEIKLNKYELNFQQKLGCYFITQNEVAKD